MRAESLYRADIDGLRAVAVLSVVLYHFQVEPFSGGFTGVDVFFVISGYLITSILSQELQRTGTLSLLDFYDRRLRRLLPAFVFVAASSLVAGYILMLPDDYERLGLQSAASVAGLANFYFLFNTGYFDREAEFLPMLHMWSLSVEEQYYAVWPLILLLTAKFFGNSRRNILALLGGIILVSLALAVYTVGSNKAPTAFYMLHTRAWELALGALLVFLPPIKGRILTELAAAIGVALIAYGVFALDVKDPFPGMNALYPCVGAALLIWQKDNATVASWLLSQRPAVFVGLISYSLYLWHWPLLVFFRIYANGDRPEGLETAWLIAASILVATFSWFAVERPFRRRRAAPLRTVQFGSAAIAATAAIGLAIASLDGLPIRLEPAAVHYAKFLNYKRPVRSRENRCAIEITTRDADACLNAGGDKPKILLMGDSHAVHFELAIRDAFPEAHFTRIIDTGCRPVLHSKGRDRDCNELMRRAYELYIPKGKFDVIILAARWRNGQHDKIAESVNYLRKYTDNVAVFGQTMEYRDTLPSILTRDYIPRRKEPLETLSNYPAVRAVDEQIRASLVTEQIDAGLQGEKVGYFSILDIICPSGRCMMTTEGNVPVQYDGHHLTYEAASFVIEKFKRAGLSVRLASVPQAD